MRLIIAGSRCFTIYQDLLDAIKLFNLGPDAIISGGARGADSLGERYAKENNLELEIYKAEWNKYGKSAGHIRNKAMAMCADTLLALWDMKSSGTKNMIYEAGRQGLVVHTYTPERMHKKWNQK